MNWVIVALLSVGAAFMLFKAKSPEGALFVVVVMVFILGPFLLTALVLSRETVFFAGIPVAAYRKRLKTIAIACNVILGAFGAIGLIACIATSQFGPILPMLVYLVPPVLNVRALRAFAIG